MTSGNPHPALVVVSDRHHRITGVSATIRNLVPIQRQGLNLKVWSRLPMDGCERLTIAQLYQLLKRPPTDQPFHIWHARRNNEMQWALLFKRVLRCPLRIVFTNSAIRRHSPLPRWLASQMDAVIATSARAGAFIDNVSATVPHGVDVERFRPLRTRPEALARLGVNFQRAIGQFGRIRPEKGSDYFVETMIRLLPKYPEFGAILVGKVTPKFERFSKYLRAKVAKAGLEDRIIWYGEVPFAEIPAVYNAMSLVVAPARYEGFGLTPLEAMASGAPVIAANTGAYAEMIEPGSTGYVFSVNDMDAFCGQLESMMSCPEHLEEMAENCQTKVVKEFPIEKEAAGIAAVYRSLWQGDDQAFANG